MIKGHGYTAARKLANMNRQQIRLQVIKVEASLPPIQKRDPAPLGGTERMLNRFSLDNEREALINCAPYINQNTLKHLPYSLWQAPRPPNGGIAG